MLNYEQEVRLINHTMKLRKHGRELKALSVYVEAMPDFIASHWSKEAKVVLKTILEAAADTESASEFLEGFRAELNKK